MEVGGRKQQLQELFLLGYQLATPWLSLLGDTTFHACASLCT